VRKVYVKLRGTKTKGMMVKEKSPLIALVDIQGIVGKTLRGAREATVQLEV
jgi:hypothetical protein